MASSPACMICVLLCISLVFTCSAAVSTSHNVTGIEKLFQEFIQRFHKSYTFGSDEYKRRLDVFKDNLHTQAELNGQLDANATTKYGITKFSDLTPQEFKDRFLSYKPPMNAIFPEHTEGTGLLGMSPGGHHSVVKDLPLKFDWAFSTVEAVESRYAIATSKLLSLSPQEVIDCSYGYRGILYGCKGGDTSNALNWMVKNQIPLVEIKDYQLKDKQQTCQIPQNSSHAVRVKDYEARAFTKVHHAEDAVVEWIYTRGPLAVAVDATNWNNYQGGVIQYHCGQVANNHAVVIVGYDISGPVPYYIVKNSWGTDFGEKGYVYIKKGGNVCGIAREVASVEVYT